MLSWYSVAISISMSLDQSNPYDRKLIKFHQIAATKFKTNKPTTQTKPKTKNPFMTLSYDESDSESEC